MKASQKFTSLVINHMKWTFWERLIEKNGITIDRPYRAQHPEYENIIYPIDYGYINGTMSSDKQEIDIFVGSNRTGLAALIHTVDHRRGDTEIKLIYNCSPEEIYLVNGFINYDQSLMTGRLVMRRPMKALWNVARKR